ncbi:probable carotenoid cleavage dioxygenase 4, chloroplastic [Andrographis paniculata]|uniref:probable carotenoid cleavage dioxygenase 4, chloroplastic n=1 Tax=Andrographis paniculata TaxID=175694 RepID=UPI0021E740A4|nr:probable carotenoid cleavage dioxygenase 4, chloroplastic [Andrographis paniculata]
MNTLPSSHLLSNIPQLFNITSKNSFPNPNVNRRNIISTDIIISSPSFPRKLLKCNVQRFNLVTILNALDEFICKFLDSPLPTCVDPGHVLAGNFAPTDELPPTLCDTIEGSIPSCLEGGAYIRNGPNPQFIPRGPYHFFDGDGMLHMIKFSKGNEATFCSRYVETYKYLAEREVGYPFVPSIFASFNGVPATVARLGLNMARVILGQFDPMNRGFGVANTSLSVIGNRLYALCESDLPYEVKLTSEGDILTVGRSDFCSVEPLLRMTAHPKVDRETGEVCAYKYDVVPPYITFFCIDSDGRKQRELPIYSMKEMTIIHDFAVTKSYVVFPDLQLVVNPWKILRGKSPVGVDACKVPRLGIVPKDATDEFGLWWIDCPGLNLLHCFNAWEEDDGDTIVMIVSNSASVEHVLEKIQSSPELTMEKVTISVRRKTMERRRLCSRSLDFATINPAYATKKTRYVYAGMVGEMRWEGVVKLDLLLSGDGDECTVASRVYEPGWCGGEPFFVASNRSTTTDEEEEEDEDEDEDDGYLVTYVHDDKCNESMFLVMDAQSPTLETVAAVKLPHRVPNGIHAIFLLPTQLDALH